MSSSEQIQLSKHGVFVEVYDLGVLITGSSGIGKSELALGLISDGHRLIADDLVWFSLCEKSGRVLGMCPPMLQNFLEVRGLGIINIRAMFGEQAIIHTKPLDLIVHILSIQEVDGKNMDRLHGMQTSEAILGQTIPEVSIPVAPGRNLGVLVEAAVRNQCLKNNGYNASRVFEQQQLEHM